MKAFKIILASLFLAFLFSSSAMAQGFGWKGKTIDDMELTFDEKVVKRDSPEALVKSFFNVLLNLRTKSSVFAQMQTLQIESERAWLGPLMTEAAQKQKFGPVLKELEFFKKHPPTYKLEIEKTEKSGTETIVHFSTSFESSRPCPKCDPEATPKTSTKDCKACKGAGIKTRKNDTRGRATVHTVDGKLFIKSMEQGCYSCKGEKVCTRCPKTPGDKCHNCNDTKVCRGCAGKGFTPDRSFQRGPSITTNLPKKEKLEAKPDLSNPQSTFSLLADALNQSKRTQRSLEARCLNAYRKFLKSYVGDSLKKARERKFDSRQYTLVKKEEIDENTLKFHYSAMSESEAARNNDKDEDEMKKARYVLVLVKVKGQWKINSFLERCWGCDGTGIDYQKASCKECKGEKYRASSHLP
ncbi:MAG: hypothetical protein P1V97_30195 [Planctomycetota bacterium]|nr:hypothetical protein [Planctomycetota bacterium]